MDKFILIINKKKHQKFIRKLLVFLYTYTCVLLFTYSSIDLAVTLYLVPSLTPLCSVVLLVARARFESTTFGL